jgi:thiol-disulfide isomerase/thioredoxin
MMRWLSICLLIGAISISAAAMAQVSAVPKASAGSESLAVLKREFEREVDNYNAEATKERDAAVQAGTLNTFRFSKEDQYPGPRYSPRFLAIAVRNPVGPDAVGALTMALETSFDFSAGKPLETRDTALELLRAHHVTKPEIKGALKRLVGLELDQQDRNLVADIVARNPDRRIQFEACRKMIEYRESFLRNISSLRQDAQYRQQIAAGTRKPLSAKMVAKFDRFERELPGLEASLHEKYADLFGERASIAEKTSIGQHAPEVVAQDLDDTAVDLSAFRGKVVVLDVWATWCGPCKSMIPFQRTMVERMKGRPFEYVSISIDENKDTLTDFLAREKMPWRHWWVGVDSRFGDAWDIRHYPTIYIIDANGIIRDKDVESCDDREAELNKVVDKLLEEMKPDAKPQAAS